MAAAKQLATYFKNLLARGALAHAYLLYGFEPPRSEGVSEKRRVADALAQLLEPNTIVLSECRVLERDEEMGIDAAREAIFFLWQKPSAAERRTLIIDGAERLTPEAQNALLKTAEEPPAHGLLLFIASAPESLVPPLRSRLQKLFVTGESKKETEKWPALGDAIFFLRSSAKEKKEFLKTLIEREKEGDIKAVSDFATALMSLLRADIVKNAAILGRLCRRLTVMGRFSVNRRLQLEAALVEP